MIRHCGALWLSEHTLHRLVVVAGSGTSLVKSSSIPRFKALSIRPGI